MALYAIGDFHLSLSGEKPMDIFGDKWADHTGKIKESFSALNDDDVSVLCGDLSWAMSLEGALEDFRFINSLPGRKIILKGNHDYWWTTVSKMEAFFRKNCFDTISILNNNSFKYGHKAICGTRGWFFEEETGSLHDRKMIMREAGRLRRSLESAGDEEKIVFLHYPPLFQNYICFEMTELLREYNVKLCCYGHIHGSSCRAAYNGWSGGTEYKLVSADWLDFKPFKIEEC
ncbi:MAG: metallophosphoesterase [Oscillospiraceae bacterium]|nr:metallophosphoesterase [Oscillospiraceae bacterium]